MGLEQAVQLGIFLALVALGFFAGRWNEARHFARLARQEADLATLLVLTERKPPHGAQAHLVVGSVVIAEDYFKHIVAAIRSCFGGHVRSYETLMERGRREAIVRMKRAARDQGADAIWGVRFETTSLAEGSIGNRTFSAEFIAYGTALRTSLG